MTDMTATIIAKSDQLNADDLIGRTLTIKITKVVLTGSDQPVAVHYEGDEGKPYMACKSMRRVMVHCWGPDANQYVGRSLTLYRDPTVRFGALEVGGIRISHMSHIEKEMVMALTEKKSVKKPYRVKPLVADAPDAKPVKSLKDRAADAAQYILNVKTVDVLSRVERSLQPLLADLEGPEPDLKAQLVQMLAERRVAINAAGEVV